MPRLAELSQQSLKPLGKMTKGKMRIQKVSNMNIVFKFLAKTVKLVGIGPQDIVDGEASPDLVLGLIWSIIVFFATKDLSGSGSSRDGGKGGGGANNLGALKKNIKAWASAYVARAAPEHGAPKQITR